MMPLKYDNFRFDWPVVSEKTFNIVYVKVSYLSAGILNDKSAFSPVMISLNSKTNTNE